MQQHHPIAERVQRAVAPVLAHAGVELLCVEFLGKSRTLRLYIDKPGGVRLDDCTEVSRRVSDLLDAEGTLEQTDGAVAAPVGEGAPPVDDAAVVPTLAGHYTLEISSPGLDRPLVQPDHFSRFLGQAVSVQLLAPLVTEATPRGTRKVVGTLLHADAQGICLGLPEGEQPLPYTMIGRARLVPNFSGA